MRQLAASLGALAIAGSLVVGVSAQAPRAAQSGAGSMFTLFTQRTDNPACAELPELRRQLERLQHELRRLHAALLQARLSGNRERAAQIMQEIRRVEAEIQDLEQRIRRPLQECRGR